MWTPTKVETSDERPAQMTKGNTTLGKIPRLIQKKSYLSDFSLKKGKNFVVKKLGQKLLISFRHLPSKWMGLVVNPLYIQSLSIRCWIGFTFCTFMCVALARIPHGTLKIWSLEIINCQIFSPRNLLEVFILTIQFNFVLNVIMMIPCP